uniref:Glycosidase n=1 Tax=Candidatus Kentrum sp. MB TaxID=2138164 RepID=A0A450Y1M3_9GAMM|nr:MAG: Glycosidase [Candidatus Kentron sp. MB]VFK35448.1 MAG: Glycosidase [Candidatus Kentron sp. MB]VFK77395.1 MAG: Glycosidase [Candidatus Kentron sp. MB]
MFVGWVIVFGWEWGALADADAACTVLIDPIMVLHHNRAESKLRGIVFHYLNGKENNMSDLVFHFSRPADWGERIYVYCWNTNPGAPDVPWPGVPMEVERDSWFVYRLADITSANMVFHDNEGRQTQDLRGEGEGWFMANGAAYDEEPELVNGNVVSQNVPFSPREEDLPTGEDFREETIYFLLTTRFNEGDPSNNFFCRDRVKFNPETGEPEDPHWRGDFKGLIERLDYIRDLGFTAIWITPPVENRSGLDYHGYHAYDWNRIDPRLESPDATYQDLIDEVHKRGMKLIQDVVINHSCQFGIRGQVHIDHLPIKYYVPQGREQGQENHGPYQGNLGNYAWPNRDDIDNPVAPEWYRDRHGRDPEGMEPLVDPKTGETVPMPGYNPGRFFGIDANELDPAWYMQHGFIAGGDWESAAVQMKHIAGDCISLELDNDNVREYLVSAINRYLDMGVDAIRMDTVKHIPRDTLLTYVNAWKAHKPGTFVFGENLVKGLGWGDLGGGDNGPSFIRPWWYTRLGNDPRDPNSGGDSGFAVLDFGLFSTFRDNVSRGSYSQVGQALSMDWIYGDPTTLVTFLQNHDIGPDNDFMFRYKGDQWMAAAAYNLIWTIRGIPCLYYGEEIEFMKGAPQDVMGERDTLETTGRAYFGDHLTDERIGETQSHPLYRHIQRLNAIRRAIPALQKAPMGHVSEWGSGVSFTRDYNNGQSYVVVGLAMGGDQDISVGGIRNGVYRDAVTGNEIRVGNSNISFHVRGNSAGIYVLNGPGKIGEDGMYLR